MSELLAIDSSIDHGVDRKTLKTIKQRFMQVNKARLARTKSALGARQQIFLELLPMMFHVNHPMLPGYVSHQTPCGLADYNPTKRDILKTQRLARSFNYNRQPHSKRRIQGLFLMGSSGTVAQSNRSDLDIWVCHPVQLNEDERLLLRQKTEAISQWAVSIGLEAHFFLMEDEKFRIGERETLSTEDCGSSQHYLLLDEFYRTGLLIAGRFPIWWLIPPDEEKHYDYYAKTLKDKRFVRSSQTVDFGGVGHIPAGEFIGAGVWQLYKAIDSPYKSVLKILLTEVYAAEFPDVEPLSTSFKRAIYNNQLDIDELDPYVVVYRKLEKYLLERNELKRLELIRRCFYFKIDKALTRPSLNRAKSWQRLLIEKLVSEWQWPNEHLLNLDARHQWKVERVTAEQKELVRELTNSYRFVLEFARRTRAAAMINSQEMTVLGRKLYAAFERKSGKIEWINPGISNNLVEEQLTFYFNPASDNNIANWSVTTTASNDFYLPTDQPIKRADELISLLAWCHFNGLLDSSTRLNIIDGEHGVSEFELFNICRSMRQHLPVAKQYTDEDNQKHEHFSQPMRPTQMLLLVNVGIDPLSHMRDQGVERISDHTDSFGYSGLRENLALNVEQVLVNSWGEVSTLSFEGDQALMRCLKNYLQLLPPGSSGSLPLLDIRCFCPTRPKAIADRVEELFRDVAACYYTGTRPANSRYVVQIQRQFYRLQFVDNNPVIESSENYTQLINDLGQPQSSFSPIVLDRNCLKGSELDAITQYAHADQIQVFYKHQDSTAEIYVLDEKGSLFFYQTAFHDEQTLLAPLDQFIQSTLFRRSSEEQNFSNSTNNDFEQDYFNLSHFELEYFEIIETNQSIQLKRRNILNEISNSKYYDVQAIAQQDLNGQPLFNIYCDQQEFTEFEFGKDLYNEVARYILNQRHSEERYPCYITDLDLGQLLPDGHAPSTQTSQYLQKKQQLESALNNALQNITPLKLKRSS
jgi:adenylate cyclase class 1